MCPGVGAPKIDNQLWGPMRPCIPKSGTGWKHVLKLSKHFAVSETQKGTIVLEYAMFKNSDGATLCNKLQRWAKDQAKIAHITPVPRSEEIQPNYSGLDIPTLWLFNNQFKLYNSNPVHNYKIIYFI